MRNNLAQNWKNIKLSDEGYNFQKKSSDRSRCSILATIANFAGFPGFIILVAQPTFG